MGLCLADLQEWDPEQINELGEAAASRARHSREAARNIANLPVFATWRGEAAQAAKDAGTEKSTRMELSAQNAFRVWAGAGHAYEEAAAVKKELNDIFAEANAAPAVHIDTATNVVMPPDTSGWTDEDVARVTAKVEALQQKIASLLLTAEKADADLAAVLRAATAAESPVTEQSGDRPSDPNAPTAASTLADLGRANDQAVVDAMAKVKAAQKALDEASKDAYTHGAGSPEAQTALAKLPELKKNLATALDELGKVPDYSGIDPKSMSIGPDGKLLFSYSLNGQTMQVTGSLKNGTGEIFDQGSHAYYTYKDGQLVGTRILDEGRAIPNDELLQNAVFTAVGAGPTAMAGKAGAEVAWQGMRALFTREAVETGAGAAAGVTADNVLPRAVVQAEHRAELAAQNLADHAPVSHIPAGAVAEHPTPLPASEHPAPVHDHPLPSGEPHGSPVPTGDVAHAQLTDSVAPAPAFTLDNPLDHMSPQLQALSEQHLTGSGETVLGPFNPADGGQSYIQVAQERGASYFDIGEAWNAATPTERLAANQHVLDMAIANRDTITLSVPFSEVRTGTFTAAGSRLLGSAWISICR
ncbi:hypothetical protein MSP7336_00368 [Mycobacterium shimoidei]|uniref:Uncharacterized protein n=1 Tax=Mycobacterium shimoidei TaxID=29313 RepID=A0A375YTA2_MYCSH|nr:hypothetical protein [Mycobacterium shimoidei]SRX92144.1 hypothetical protein MSP7336_00368 [Mycobacterium shimoidei]